MIQTVREQLLGALEAGRLASKTFNGMLSRKMPDEEIVGALDSLLDTFEGLADAAIERAKREPELPIDPHAVKLPGYPRAKP